ncbi:reverse transcriptase [Gossypium australe]|uniref:Reverse transcriptase n=1 Tax=Gossypium australe TaxID=47621 RepID=A0A5B6W3J8_9ROSI|nr:reverse transcriptase [Gossypium australe]
MEGNVWRFHLLMRDNLLFQTILDRRLPMGKPAVHNENHLLECPWVGELTSDTILKEKGIQEDWRFTGFYGSPYLKDKSAVWDLFRRLGQERDFNEILYGFEKKGGVQREQRRMDAFRDTLEECQLMDIGYSGTWFTWERGNLLETNIRERWDRRVANEKWITLFPMGNIQHLPYSMSDHCPLLISTDHTTEYSGNQKFHFEAWWTLEESTKQVIKEAWELYLEPLIEKLGKLQSRLKTWARFNRNKKEG